MSSPSPRTKQFLKLNTNLSGCEFIRLYIQMQDIPTFPILTHQTATIGHLAKQIKAELAVKELERTHNDSQTPAKILYALEYDKVPNISQLYESSNIALPFNALVKDVLGFDEVVVPISFDVESMKLLTQQPRTIVTEY